MGITEHYYGVFTVMTTPEERIAVLESKLSRNERDITKLFQFIRDHMDREEKQMEKSEQARNEIKSQIAQINNSISNQKSFVGGMFFTISAFWTVATALAYWIFKIKQ